MGHNGSGKSTLLKCIAGSCSPDHRSVRTKGQPGRPARAGSGFHPELSGRENVFLNGSILGMTKQEIDRKFDEIVDFAGVEAFIDQPVKNYSSGMYVRLGFSVAINVDPESCWSTRSWRSATPVPGQVHGEVRRVQPGR